MVTSLDALRSKHTNSLFSGGLDRQVYLWDVSQPRPEDPVATLKFPDLIGGEGGKGSIYALTASKSFKYIPFFGREINYLTADDSRPNR